MTLDPLGERMYLLAQVKRGSPFRLQVPGACGGQERGADQGVYELKGDDGSAGGGYPVVCCLLLGDPWGAWFCPR